MKDMVGVKINRLTGIKPSFQDGKGQWHWLFACDCGNEKVVNAVNVRNGQTKSCGCAFLGHFPSKETKQKMRLAKLGTKQTKEHIEKVRKSNLKTRRAPGYVNPLVGKPGPWTGKKRPENSGENNPRWKGGVSLKNRTLRQNIMSTFEYKNWRKTVFLRDGYTCQKCKKTGVTLNADHIEAFSLIMKKHNIDSVTKALICDELWKIENGRTLCVPCHERTENYKRRALLINK